MQNSLERLCEGIAASLRREVLPALDDAYARSQVLAAVELVGNLGARVEWRCADLREEVERIRRVLATAAEPSALLVRPVPEGNAELVEARDEHLAELGRLQERGALDSEALREFLAWQLERERGYLRAGVAGT